MNWNQGNVSIIPALQFAVLLCGSFLMVGLTACQTTKNFRTHDLRDTSRPFPFVAWLAAEQRLLDSPRPFEIQKTPEPVIIRKRNPGALGISVEESRLAGFTYMPSNSVGPRRVVVDLAQQKAWVLRGDWVEAVTRISSGRRNYPTPAGPYVVIQKSREHRSNLYGNYVDTSGKVIQSDVDVRKDPLPEGAIFVGSPMPFFLRLKDPANKIHGVGFHAGTLPGYPASHGCIRLPYTMAQWLFDTTEIGTPVLIVHAYPLPRASENESSTRKKTDKIRYNKSSRKIHSMNEQTRYF